MVERSEATGSRGAGSRADFEPTDAGTTVYFALRWLNTRGQPGPWSHVYDAVIPS